MSFEDIDTPVADDVLEGVAADPVAVPETDPVVSGENADPENVDPAVDPELEVDPQPERAPVIPRARFDEVNAKLHSQREENEALRAQLEALQRQPEKESDEANSIEALEQQYFDAMMAGDQGSAVSIRAKINAEIESRAESKAAERINRQMTEREQAAAMGTVVSTAYQSYPFLDHLSEHANEKAINDVVEWRDFYAQKGEPLHVALQKAVAKVGPMYAPEATKEKPVDTRKQAAIDRNIQDANAQPPANVAGVGNRAAPQAPKIETQKDWESLSEAERDRLLMEG